MAKVTKAYDLPARLVYVYFGFLTAKSPFCLLHNYTYIKNEFLNVSIFLRCSLVDNTYCQEAQHFSHHGVSKNASIVDSNDFFIEI